MLSILLNYGVELGLPACLELAQALERMTLSPQRELLNEWRRKKPQQLPMTYAFAEAIVDEGLNRGERRYRSLALGVAAQFELTIAQIDVIGFWERIDGARSIPDGTIVQGKKAWRPGLRYEDFLPDMVLDMRRSRNSKRGIFDLAEYPLFMRALAAVPEAERLGVVAVDNAGEPFQPALLQRPVSQNGECPRGAEGRLEHECAPRRCDRSQTIGRPAGRHVRAPPALKSSDHEAPLRHAQYRNNPPRRAREGCKSQKARRKLVGAWVRLSGNKPGNRIPNKHSQHIPNSMS